MNVFVMKRIRVLAAFAAISLAVTAAMAQTATVRIVRAANTSCPHSTPSNVKPSCMHSMTNSRSHAGPTSRPASCLGVESA
jgi:hypothetical protein